MVNLGHIKIFIAFFFLLQNQNSFKFDSNENYIATYSKGFLVAPEKFDNIIIEYTLKFNESLSKFEISDKKNLKLKESVVLNGSGIYFNESNDAVLNHLSGNSIFSDKYLIQRNHESLRWNITSETKILNGFTCYKAFRYPLGLDFKENKNEPVLTAWFAPKLNFKHGPADAVGLPGLVLEYTHKNYFYRLETLETTSIDNNDDFVNGLKPKGDFKKIAYLDYMKKVMKWYRGMKKKYRK